MPGALTQVLTTSNVLMVLLHAKAVRLPDCSLTQAEFLIPNVIRQTEAKVQLHHRLFPGAHACANIEPRRSVGTAEVERQHFVAAEYVVQVCFVDDVARLHHVRSFD